METIAIFIPHHRNPALLEDLFSSLDAMTCVDATVRIVLVDNGSADGSVELTRGRFPFVEILSLGQNYGFAPALNMAVRRTECDRVCFLNNDMRVDAQWLARMMEAARTLPAGALASHILDWEGNATQFGGGTVNRFGKGFETPAIAGDEPYPVFFPCGGAMMMRRDLFLDAGGFDDDFFMIYEDVDLGWRLRLFGYENYLVPAARVYHRGHASLRQEGYRRKAVFLERNSLATLYKNLSGDSLAVTLPLALREAGLRSRALGGFGTPFGFSQDGAATAGGVQAFLEKMETWRKKRVWVQDRRVVDDSVIFERFFAEPGRLWAYCDEHYHRLHTPEVKNSLEMVFLTAENALE